MEKLNHPGQSSLGWMSSNFKIKVKGLSKEKVEQLLGKDWVLDKNWLVYKVRIGGFY